MGTKRITITGPELTTAQKNMIRKHRNAPVEYDEDLPKFTKKQLAQFKRVSEQNRSDRIKQTITLRLYPSTIRKAKSLGKGYTGILGRLLDMALDNPEMVKKAL